MKAAAGPFREDFYIEIVLGPEAEFINDSGIAPDVTFLAGELEQDVHGFDVIVPRAAAERLALLVLQAENEVGKVRKTL